MHVIETIEKYRMVPVVKLARTMEALPLAEALCEGGLPLAEITFRTDCAAGVIAEIARSMPGMCVGAGTVLRVEQAQQAAEAGARFIVSPGLNPEVVRWCQTQGIPVIPGCVTPSEIERAMELGLRVVKFFPAEAFGGVRTIAALHGPYPDIRFLPTGGISLQNLSEYLRCTGVLACGGSFMARESDIGAGNFAAVTKSAAAASALRENLCGHAG